VAERRADDTPEAIQRRLDTFDAETGSLLEWLDGRGLVTTVSGIGSADEVAARLSAVVRTRLSGSTKGASATATLT
jgi:adenylate kinase